MQCLSNALQDMCKSDMACLLCIALTNDPQYYVTHCSGVPLATSYNSNGVDQIMVLKNSGFYKLFIEERHGTPLASHLSVWKLTYALF